MNDNLTEETEDGKMYDPQRYDPSLAQSYCLDCGTTLRGVGDASTVGQYCPECEVNVWIA